MAIISLYLRTAFLIKKWFGDIWFIMKVPPSLNMTCSEKAKHARAAERKIRAQSFVYEQLRKFGDISRNWFIPMKTGVPGFISFRLWKCHFWWLIIQCLIHEPEFRDIMHSTRNSLQINLFKHKCKKITAQLPWIVSNNI